MSNILPNILVLDLNASSKGFLYLETPEGLILGRLIMEFPKLKVLDILYHKPQDFKTFSTIGSGEYASVYAAYWKSTQTILAIKKFNASSTKQNILNEIKLMEIIRRKVNFHPNIIKFYGVMNLEDEINYALILEYADGGTLGNYLRDNAINFKWESQLKFAHDIASAILWLYDNEIIH
ncbi:10716_t:CDS:2 [Funneliformis geosporum]|uniref:10716_t:CDS:1 n=1 Tax=Funneliformis geosporum TaxID=1117311 RepID=A0A9W4SMT9_9GLOM|nr:10716_t:CDS:2 [Funneliformis geosporum]